MPISSATPRPTLRAAVRAHWNAQHFALLTSLPIAVTLVSAALDAEGQLSMLFTVPVLAGLAGLVVGLLRARRLHSMLTGTLIGLLVGVSAAWRIIGYNVYGSFAITVATLALFGAIGFMVGTFVEFVQLLHFVAHGGKVREYRRL